MILNPFFGGPHNSDPDILVLFHFSFWGDKAAHGSRAVLQSGIALCGPMRRRSLLSDADLRHFHIPPDMLLLPRRISVCCTLEPGSGPATFSFPDPSRSPLFPAGCARGRARARVIIMLTPYIFAIIYHTIFFFIRRGGTYGAEGNLMWCRVWHIPGANWRKNHIITETFSETTLVRLVHLEQNFHYSGNFFQNHTGASGATGARFFAPGWCNFAGMVHFLHCTNPFSSAFLTALFSSVPMIMYRRASIA